MHFSIRPDRTKAPTFAVSAMKDPESVNLDRIQIVKGRYQSVRPREKICDIARSDWRTPDTKTGKLSHIGNTLIAAGIGASNSYITIGDFFFKKNLLLWGRKKGEIGP